MEMIIMLFIIAILAMISFIFLIKPFKNIIRKEIFRINSLQDYGNVSEKSITDISFEEILVCKGFSEKNGYLFQEVNNSSFFTIEKLLDYIHEEELFFGYCYKVIFENDSYKLVRIPNMQFLEHKIAMNFGF